MFIKLNDIKFNHPLIKDIIIAIFYRIRFLSGPTDITVNPYVEKVELILLQKCIQKELCDLKAT